MWVIERAPSKGLVGQDALILLVLMALAGCAYTKARPVEAAPKLTPTCAAAVRVFADADSVGAEYQALAVLRPLGAIATRNITMLSSLREKAAQFGANGVIYPVLAIGPSSLADVQGEATAIYIPSDSARVPRECAEAKRRWSDSVSNVRVYRGLQ